MVRTIFDEVLKPLEEEEEIIPKTTDTSSFKTEEAIPVAAKKTRTIFDSAIQAIESDTEEVQAVKATKNAMSNTAIQDAAMRFAKDRLGQEDITKEEAMAEYIEHFRSFNVNELTAAGDFNYVSAAAADATKRKDKKAAQRLSDYRLLYQAFEEMPAFSDGVGTATLDYIQGLATAPSTYVGLALPGIGKGAGIAATQAAKEGVKFTLKNAFTKPVSLLASQAAARPLATTIGVEAAAGSLQNIAAQKTEIEADLRDDFSYGELATVGAISGVAAPAALIPGAIKGAITKKVEAKTGDLVGEATAAVLKRNEEALERTNKVLETDTELAASIKAALPSLDPENILTKTDVTKKRKLDPEDIAAGEKTIDVEAEKLGMADWQKIAPSKEHVSRIFGAVTEIMAKANNKPKPGERISEAVARVVREGDLGEKVAPDIMKKYNITSDDLASLLIAEAHADASRLGSRSAASKMFNNLNEVAASDIFALTNDRKKVLEKVSERLDQGDGASALKLLEPEREVSFVRALDQLRLASMTSQTATTIRNTASGVTRVGIDVMMKGFDRGIASAVKKVSGRADGKVGFNSNNPNEDVFAVLYGMVNGKESKAIQSIFKMGYDKKAKNLYRSLRDIEDAAGDGVKVTKMRALSQELNALNTMSDDIFKRAAFSGSLKRRLNELYTRELDTMNKKIALRDAGEDISKLGPIREIKAEDYDLVEIIRQGKFNDAFAGKERGKLLDDAVNDALTFTYQRDAQNDTVRGIISGIHKFPFLTTSLVPFPRFVANAMRFTWEYSPLYMLAKNKQGERVISQLVGKGSEENYEKVGKALTGVALYSAAYAFRSSENAGENWWEYKMDDGSTFDLRPFFPAAPFLFFADLAKRAVEGDPIMGDTSFITDAIQALSGTQFRAGFGIYALDSALRDLDGINFFDEETTAEMAAQKFAKIGVNFFANAASTFMIPATTGQDLYNTFIAPDDERIVRQTDMTLNGMDDVLSMTINKSLARLPGNFAMQEMLAESIGTKPAEIYESPTRDAPLRRMTPITRQTFGILKQERRNFFENELAKLKINRKILTSKTGVPEADQLINAMIGEYTTDFIVPVLKNSEDYKGLDNSQKKDFIRSVIKEYKADIMDVVKMRSGLSGKERYGFDPMQRVAFNKLGPVAQKRALDKYHEVFGKPKDGELYDYEQLVDYGKFYQKLGVR